MEIQPLTFQAPQFAAWSIIYTALGASFFWFKSARSDLKAYVMSDLVGLFIKDRKKRYVVEFLLFIIFGTLIGVALTQPVNSTQAVTAGIAWTSAFSYFGGDNRKTRR